MNVYLIQGDSTYFGANYQEQSQLCAVMDSDRENRPVTDRSVIIGRYYSGVDKEEPVFTDIGYLGTGTTLLLRRPRTDVLRPMLLNVGTILPMTTWKGQTFEAFICDHQLDALDPDRMEYHPKSEMFAGTEILRFAFRSGMVADATLFRTTGLRGRLFATDRFLDLFKAYELTGLLVLPLWSSETGPLATLTDPDDEFGRYPPAPGTNKHEKRTAMRAILARRGDP